MIIVALICLLFLGGVLALIADRFKLVDPRWVSIASLVLGLVLAVGFYLNPGEGVVIDGQEWLVSIRAYWIPRFGISALLAMDGLSFLMVLLTLFLGIVAVLSSWKEIEHSQGFFQFNLLWVLAGVVGVFTALDLFLFFMFWEVMLIPMYFIIAIWGHENRRYAAIKFFIFTQASGLLMLLAMVVLVYFHYEAEGFISFNYFDLLGTSLPPGMGFCGSCLVSLLPLWSNCRVSRCIPGYRMLIPRHLPRVV